jgi:uracil-DNA glycosylase family 4
LGVEHLSAVAREVVCCRACERLVAWREESAARPPRRFRGESYWARPVPGFGDPAARLLIVGLAPAAHGGNRTGRVFTGDSSGDFLFAALHRARLSNQPLSVSANDGLALRGAYIAAAVRCAPPDNRPTPGEFARCRPFLVREIEALPRLAAVLALGALAWRAALGDVGEMIPRPLPRFSHGARVRLSDRMVLHGSYHVSRQNTSTRRLTPAMLDAVLMRIGRELG